MDFNSIQDTMVRDYLMKKYGSNKVADAQAEADTASTAGVVAGAADNLSNAFNQPVALQNRMQDLGKAPAMVGGGQQKTDVSGLQKQAQMKLAQAQSDEDDAVKMAFEQRKAELAAKAAAKKAEDDAAWRQKEFDLKERSLDAQNRSRNAYADATLGLKREQLNIEREKLGKTVPAQAAKQKEVDYRINSMNSALDRLEKNVKENGTFELLGDASSAMDSDLYNLAIDYAKLVDPDSVAREGEVAAAQKYMLPIKGMGVRNETALAIIKRMRDQVAQRAADMGVGSKPAPATSGVLTPEEQAELQELEARFGGK